MTFSTASLGIQPKHLQGVALPAQPRNVRRAAIPMKVSNYLQGESVGVRPPTVKVRDSNLVD